METVEQTTDPEVFVCDGVLTLRTADKYSSLPMSQNPAYNLALYNQRGPDCVVEIGRSTFKCSKLQGLKMVLKGIKKGEIA